MGDHFFQNRIKYLDAQPLKKAVLLWLCLIDSNSAFKIILDLPD